MFVVSIVVLVLKFKGKGKGKVVVIKFFKKGIEVFFKFWGIKRKFFVLFMKFILSYNSKLLLLFLGIFFFDVDFWEVLVKV